jgi:hypothetical protein
MPVDLIDQANVLSESLLKAAVPIKPTQVLICRQDMRHVQIERSGTD